MNHCLSCQGKLKTIKTQRSVSTNITMREYYCKNCDRKFPTCEIYVPSLIIASKNLLKLDAIIQKTIKLLP